MSTKIQKADILKKFRKRSKAKYMTNAITNSLRNLDSPLRKSYINTYYCNHMLKEHKGKLIGSYCKNRWCLICNRIKIAHLINGYQSELEKFKDPQFVTLTARTVPAEQLSERIDLMIKNWIRLAANGRMRKRNLNGIRKLECTSRPNNLYHPHFHLVVDGKDNAEWIVKQWLRHWEGEAKRDAQDIRKADKGSLLELFKYFTKLIIKNRSIDFFNEKPTRVIMHAKNLDVIFQAMRGRRVYQSFGKVRKVNEDEAKEEAFFEVEEGAIYKYVDYDWYELNTGEALTGWIPNNEIKDLVYPKEKSKQV